MYAYVCIVSDAFARIAALNGYNNNNNNVSGVTRRNDVKIADKRPMEERGEFDATWSFSAVTIHLGCLDYER